MYNLYDLNLEGAKQSVPIWSSKNVGIPEAGVRFMVYAQLDVSNGGQRKEENWRGIGEYVTWWLVNFLFMYFPIE